MKKLRVRKPRRLILKDGFEDGKGARIDSWGDIHIYNCTYLSAKEARRLAAWLVKAEEYLKAREER